MIEPDEEDNETIADATAQFLYDSGAWEISSSDPSPGTWYSGTGDENYQTGVTRTLSYHLRGYTPEEEVEVFEEFERLKKKGRQ